ncbi:adenylyl-sulfate kinase [Nocardioides sp. CFH 31398]|uniref:adenylyl-sulfate kinase n=1 Tax=Nocardioides sp. CFH 31398 TaxID=2919579 RepID=UPI001F0563EB|nr:adenylyl-sulfate kinase [Nocardioides sp. CFH 31398]MCH1865987.1 adenylyl-sulfate kinase [Nocardioides sp. CFH 31398]
MSAPLPQHCPSPTELDDLELLLSGAAAPAETFGGPLALDLPEDVATARAEAGALELVDPEGLPLARLAADGSLSALSRPAYGAFRRLYLTPAETRADHAGRTVVPVEGPLGDAQIDELAAVGGPVLLLALAGASRSCLSTPGLVRATLAAADRLPDAVVVVVPLAGHAGDPDGDAVLRRTVVQNYAGNDPLLELGAPGAISGRIAEIVTADRPPAAKQGLVLFFTGLSGSGKSTIARALMDRLLESTDRTVTSLDGDVVRRNLSAGLTFSRADRETNIRRIGWVAAEISRHGGLAVCSPIAPFAETRAQVRAMVEDARGAFVLVHVATPLEECERRDRKGLYAKARRGEIPEFTGISSPYEEPDDAAVRVDTTGRSIGECVDEVWAALVAAGYLEG